MAQATAPVIEAIELHRVEVPLVRPFEASFGRETARDVLLVRVRTDRGDGWGECVAGRDPFYSSEYVEGAASVIERYLAPALLEGRSRHAANDGHVSGVLIEDAAHSAGIWVDDREQHVEGQDARVAATAGAAEPWRIAETDAVAARATSARPAR